MRNTEPFSLMAADDFLSIASTLIFHYAIIAISHGRRRQHHAWPFERRHYAAESASFSPPALPSFAPCSISAYIDFSSP